MQGLLHLLSYWLLCGWCSQVDQLTAETQSLGAEVEELNRYQWQLQQEYRAKKNELLRLETLVSHLSSASLGGVA